MMSRIGEAVVGALNTGRPAFLLDIDIDRFKQINESIGYSLGDDLSLILRPA